MKNLTKILALALTLALLAVMGNAVATTVNNNPIYVISREEGSGTRSAFVELFGVQTKDADGKNVDNTIDTAEITNSTAVMMVSVAGDPNAIGYISLGSLNDTVKAVRIEGVEASVENIKNKSYPISRPFNIVTNSDTSDEAMDFINYILSEEGQAVVEKGGYIPLDDAPAFQGANPSGKIVVAGSSSVSPIMEKLIEAYGNLNPSLVIEIQTSDSTTGVNSTIEGICNIGMASRELKDSEIEKGCIQTQIAIDGLAVIVANENTVETLTKEQVKGVYTGEVTKWSEVQ
ncbi:phosphate-binding protein PstS 2 [Clostridia bacterium]|nr:phosphate-binding protein PstS 2 [Clostridia bacterium]